MVVGHASRLDVFHYITAPSVVLYVYNYVCMVGYGCWTYDVPVGLMCLFPIMSFGLFTYRAAMTDCMCIFMFAMFVFLILSNRARQSSSIIVIVTHCTVAFVS